VVLCSSKQTSIKQTSNKQRSNKHQTNNRVEARAAGAVCRSIKQSRVALRCSSGQPAERLRVGPGFHGVKEFVGAT
jgi:hypothetical protein